MGPETLGRICEQQNGAASCAYARIQCCRFPTWQVTLDDSCSRAQRFLVRRDGVASTRVYSNNHLEAVTREFTIPQVTHALDDRSRCLTRRDDGADTWRNPLAFAARSASAAASAASIGERRSPARTRSSAGYPTATNSVIASAPTTMDARRPLDM